MTNEREERYSIPRSEKLKSVIIDFLKKNLPSSVENSQTQQKITIAVNNFIDLMDDLNILEDSDQEEILMNVLMLFILDDNNLLSNYNSDVLKSFLSSTLKNFTDLASSFKNINSAFISDEERHKKSIKILKQYLKTLKDISSKYFPENKPKNSQARNSQPKVNQGESEKNKQNEGLVTPEELKSMNKWQKFFYYYGKDESGRMLRETKKGSLIIRGSKENDSDDLKKYIVEMRHRTFSDWYISNWFGQMKFPNSFNKAIIREMKLPEIDHDLTFASLSGAGSGMDTGISFMFGVTGMLNMGADMYQLQLAGLKTFEAIELYKSQDLDHMFNLGKLRTGEFTATEYLQIAHQFFTIHDPEKRRKYKPLLEGHLGSKAFKFFEPKSAENNTTIDFEENIKWLPNDYKNGKLSEDIAKAIGLLKGRITCESGRIKYNGYELHEIMVQEDSGITLELKQMVIYRFILLLIQQDRARLDKIFKDKGTHYKEVLDENNNLKKVPLSSDNCSPLEFKEARFIAELMLNVGSAFQLFPAQDNKNVVSKMFFTRLMYLDKYRTKKAAGKPLGSENTLSFFKRLFPEGFEEFLINDTGINLEQVWMLAGVGEETGVGEINPYIKNMQRVQEFYRFIPSQRNHTLNKPGMLKIDDVNKMSVKATNWNYPDDIGILFRRMGGFVMPFYKYITGEERILDDWMDGRVVRNSVKLKKFHNDKAGYYFGDLNKQAEEPKENEAEEEFFERIKEKRILFAQKGYILVKGKKRDANSPELFVADKNEQNKTGKTTTTDHEKAKVEYKFTPIFEYFSILSNEELKNIKNDLLQGITFGNGIEAKKLKNDHVEELRNLNPRNLLTYLSEKDPALLQSILIDKVHPDVLGKAQDRFTQWFIIGELSMIVDEFKKKSDKEKKNIIDDIYAGLNQYVYNLKYLNPTSRMNEENVGLAGFGRFSFDDITYILREAGWIRESKLSDLSIKQHIFELRLQYLISKKSSLKTSVQEELDKLRK